MKYIIAAYILMHNIDLSAQEVNLDRTLDSLKWKYYALTFDVELYRYADDTSHFRIIEDSIFNAVECEIKIDTIEYEGDTIKYYFDFIRNNPADKYVQKKADPFVGVAFVQKKKAYIPLLGKTYLTSPLEFYKSFFDKREIMFLDFVKKYSGFMTPWLKKELIKRNVLE